MAEIKKPVILSALLADGRGSRSYAELSPKIKAVLLNKIAFDLARCEKENGADYCIEVWGIVQREIAVMDWLRKCGPFALWRSTYVKASRKVNQDKIRTAGEVAGGLVAELQKRSRENAETVTA